MQFYKKAYRVIAIIIAVCGILLIPFLDYIVKDPGDIGNIRIYYCIFLFNTVISYFVSYKYSLVNAEQKTYILTRIDSVVSIISTVLQLVALIITRNFVIYLLSASCVGVARLFYVSHYLNKKFPILVDKDVKPISKEELAPIKKNVKALIWHKIGDVCIHQSDNIITSAVIGIGTVGLMSNYNMIMSKITVFIKEIFNSAMPSLGNMVAVESREKQFSIYKVYNFMDFWIYGFSSLAFFFLLSPTIELWLGKEMLVDTFTIFLVCFNFYIAGQRISFLNYKTAFGVFSDDKFIVIIAAVINLVTSIICAKQFGLCGIYIGTVISSLFQSISRPIIAYNRITGDRTINYFKKWFTYLLLVATAGIVIYLLNSLLPSKLNFLIYLVRIGIVTIVPNVLFYIIYRKTPEFDYLKKVVTTKVLRRFKNG